MLIEKQVEKYLRNVADPDYSRLRNAIEQLAENPRPQGCKKLKGRSGYRIRQGTYRIIYEIHDKQLVVLVIDLGTRQSVYG